MCVRERERDVERGADVLIEAGAANLNLLKMMTTQECKFHVIK